MADQAKRLRELVEGLDHAATLPVESEPGLDKAKLWDAMKAELEADIGRPSITNAKHGSKAEKRIDRDAVFSEKVLDRMLRAEDLAMPTGQRDKVVR